MTVGDEVIFLQEYADELCEGTDVDISFLLTDAAINVVSRRPEGKNTFIIPYDQIGPDTMKLAIDASMVYPPNDENGHRRYKPFLKGERSING